MNNCEIEMKKGQRLLELQMRINKMENGVKFVIDGFEVIDIKRDSMHKDDWYLYSVLSKNSQTGQWAVHLLNIDRIEFSLNYGHYFTNDKVGYTQARQYYRESGVSSDIAGFNTIG